EAQNEKARRAGLENLAELARLLGQVEGIHRARYRDVGVRVEARDKLPAAVPQVALDFEYGFRAALAGPPAAAEFLAHRVIGHVGDVADHAGDGEPAHGAGSAVVVAAVEIRVGDNGLAPHLVESD